MDAAFQTYTQLRFRRKKGRLLVDGEDPVYDTRILHAVARAHHWQRLLDSGRFQSISEIARAEDLKPTTVARMMRLARLAPDIVEALMAGCQPARLTLLWLQRHDIPALWADQSQVIRQFQ